ncbi:hypothetical protein BHE90_013702 [Fusarium euwallaceae]|uniref:Adenylate kinase n=1 Tax=Fusarium euwallaceae TaxID=1147111 RepID=A0A430L899_9HYPO|nr:hypothetical protein BHE90_013702 [Fusarium euwallaceae]
MSILKPQVQNANDTRPILLDGFPRQLDQAKLFEDVYGHAHLVLFFDCPRNLAEERVVTRQAGRDGDDIDTFRRRYGEFLELNPPVLAHYAAGGRLVIVRLQLPAKPAAPIIAVVSLTHYGNRLIPAPIRKPRTRTSRKYCWRKSVGHGIETREKP